MGKPKIDLKDVTVQAAIQHVDRLIAVAGMAPGVVQEGLLPVWNRNGRKGQPELLGTSILVQGDREYFLLSASHVLSQLKGHVVTVGDAYARALHDLVGTRISAEPDGPDYHHDSAIDASVLHIEESLPTTLSSRAVPRDFIEQWPNPVGGQLCLVNGFPGKRARIKGQELEANDAAFHCLEYDQHHCDKMGFDNANFLAVSFERWGTDGRLWQQSPTPRGISGGAMITFSDLSSEPPLEVEGVEMRVLPRQRLAAIVTAHEPERNGKVGALIGTRTHVHCQLIRNHLDDIGTDGALWFKGPET